MPRTLHTVLYADFLAAGITPAAMETLFAYTVTKGTPTLDALHDLGITVTRTAWWNMKVDYRHAALLAAANERIRMMDGLTVEVVLAALDALSTKGGR